MITNILLLIAFIAIIALSIHARLTNQTLKEQQKYLNYLTKKIKQH